MSVFHLLVKNIQLGYYRKKNHGHIKLYCFRLELLLGHTGAFCCSLYLYIFFSSWGLSWWSLWQTRVCVSSESCGSKWPLAISPEYILLIWSFGFNYFWIGECFYHDLIDYAKTLCCYYMASTYIMCETTFPPTYWISSLFMRLQDKTWIILDMHSRREFSYILLCHLQYLPHWAYLYLLVKQQLAKWLEIHLDYILWYNIVSFDSLVTF